MQVGCYAKYSFVKRWPERDVKRTGDDWYTGSSLGFASLRVYLHKRQIDVPSAVDAGHLETALTRDCKLREIFVRPVVKRNLVKFEHKGSSRVARYVPVSSMF